MNETADRVTGDHYRLKDLGEVDSKALSALLLDAIDQSHESYSTNSSICNVEDLGAFGFSGIPSASALNSATGLRQEKQSWGF